MHRGRNTPMLASFQQDLRLYGQRFRPDDVVRIYICGPTVWDDSHVGHARAYTVGDSIRRVLRDGFAFRTRYVLNITDVDDKIIRRAREQGTDWRQVARKYEDEFWRDMDRLNVLRPDVAPRVSEYIAPIVEFVQTLQARGMAYPIASSGVYFDTQAFQAQGFVYPDKVHAERKAPAAHGAGRAGRAQEACCRLCAVEMCQARRAVMGNAFGHWTTGMVCC